MNAKGVFNIALCSFLFGALLVGAVGYSIVFIERTKSANDLAEARRIGDNARAGLDGLTIRLGSIVTDLDGALKEVGRIGDVVQRLRARDGVYSKVAQRIREIAGELDKGQTGVGIPP